MSRATVDYGIDLGTTNSSIAVAAGVGTEVIKNNVDADITPSAVYINRAGNLWVGQSARSKMGDERAEDDVFLEFKRRMGTDYEYVFRSNGRKMRPEDLSAEVLKSLRADVTSKKAEEIAAAVIAVPAAFELHQCDATKRAAELAGLKTVSFVQEPVAAALAYGYQQLSAKAYWLVFDFGGGTFDAALIRAEDGMMVVANHGGDNFLGGSDIDWAVVEQVLAPRVAKEYKKPKFQRGIKTYNYDLIRLKAAAETAKIELSNKYSTFIEATLRNVADETVTFETQITRQEVAAVAEPIIRKAVAIATRVLTEKGLAPSAVEKLIFVGGPTLAPYFRDIVKQQLGIAFDLAIDPLTVVARGAAIFSSTQKLAVKTTKPTTTTAKNVTFPIDLIYKPVGADAEPLVGGKVAAAPGITSLEGYTVEIVNQQSKWRSGQVPLKANASFQFPVRAEKGAQNTFQLQLRNATGTVCETEPAQFTYTMGLVLEEQTIIHNMGVATSDNKVAVHFRKGQGLPAKFTKTYRTATALSQGQSGSVIKVPIVEGDRDLADRNILIGAVEIRSDKIKRDLPAGSEIEVTLNMDVSRLLTVIAYVPLLDEEFPAKIELGGKVRQPDLQVLRDELGREAQRLAELKAAGTTSVPTALKKVQALEASMSWRHLQDTLSREGADFDALLKADRELLDFKLQLDEIATHIAWPTAVQEAEKALEDLDRLVGLHGTPDEKGRARGLRDQVRSIVGDKNMERLKKKITEINDVHSSVLYRQPSFWTGYFESLVVHEAAMRDAPRAAALLKEGRSYAAKLQVAELKNVIYQLQDLLPAQTVEDARRGYGSGILGS
jgi:molecular chaperone DnaK